MKSELPKTLELGCVAKDTISGFTGIVVAITEWLNGCIRITLQPQKLDGGKLLDSGTFDVEQIAVVKPLSKPRDVKRHGGPSISPIRGQMVGR